MKKQRGFTLIELLTVMAIIAILAAISVFSFQGARKQGRDAKRKADLATIASALEIYKADCGQYPSSLPAVGSSLSSTCTNPYGNTYIKKLPGDPTTGSKYSYSSSSPYTDYVLCATLEDVTSGTCSSGTGNYEVLSP